MTEETAQKIIEQLELIDKSNILSAVCMLMLIIGMIAYTIISIWKYKKVKKMLEEYNATLTEEQREILRKYKEITKI